ncbi:MAG: cytochrome c3 family protein, partial [Pseudomonadota bacterium]
MRRLLWGFVIVLCCWCVEAEASDEHMGVLENDGERRADIVEIDTLASFGALELPAVTFYHDKHTEALKKKGKDCKECHLVDEEKKQMSLKFKRVNDANAEEAQNIYHANCIGCHEKMKREDKTGPLDGACRVCHNAKVKVISSWQSIGFDKALHYRHADSKEIVAAANEKDNCGRCHHEYDKEAKRLFYAKGKEGTCRYCHLDRPKEDVKSMSQASHIQCISCHQELVAKGKKDVGPVQCSGCHGPDEQNAVAHKNEKLVTDKKVLPRIKREQPDTVLITLAIAEAQEGDASPKTDETILTMSPVAFDHKSHEQYNSTCRVCHHAAMESCSKKCHTLKGSEDGKYVQLEQAMHNAKSEKSCVGCHTARQGEKNCRGCHGLIKSDSISKITCSACHLKEAFSAVQEGGQAANKIIVMPKEQRADISRKLLEARQPVREIYNTE